LPYNKPIVLINPPVAELPGSQIFVTTMPLGIAYIAAYLLKKGFRVKVIDALGLGLEKVSGWKHGLRLRGLTIGEIVKSIPNESELICISTNFTSQHKVYIDLVSRLRERFPKKKIIIGGNEATANYKRFLKPEGADYAVLGEAEETMLKLANALSKKDSAKAIEAIDGIAYRKNGKIAVRKKKGFIKNLDMLPFPARHLFPLENYWKAKRGHGPVNKRFTAIISSRGCPYNCTYCSSSVFWNRHWAARKPENFVREMQHCIEKYGITEFEIEDDNLTLDIERAKKIFRLIKEKKLGITWTTPNGVRPEHLDIETLQLMKDSGCTLLVLAPESGSQRILKEVYNKRIDLENIAAVAKNCSRLGIKTTAFFVVGLPVEREDDRQKTKAYLKRLARIGVDEVGVFPCIPYPNTEVRKRYFKGNIKGIDSLNIGTVPEWYPNSRAVNNYVKQLYITFLLYKAVFHPVNVLKMLFDVISNRQSIKMERELINWKNRLLKGSWFS